ncbi:transcriptional repressor, LacI family protein [Reinekea sp. MED297]|uniref:Transcriptional repressor, LacI family protein n=1 Tax=Reinekea blandensis MED297 TaxID=314283 RepID=A4BKQ4_9GAMM|nr:transcriptional repressor, LacI family protein [Reinekea sp. MED297] [Reinekea blandensis MED297]
MAGVSTATVSRALANPEKVSEATRAKVAQAVRETGYSPNAAARSLRRSESKTIVVILPDIANPFFSDVISGLEEVAHSAGYKVLLGDSAHDPKRAQDYFDLVPTNQADGIILLTTEIPYTLVKDRQLKSGFPLVMACEYFDDLELPTIYVDNEKGASKAIDYLLDMGHTHIASISGPISNPICRDRHQGFLNCLRKKQLNFDEKYLRQGDFSFSAGYQQGRVLLQMKDRPTAFFCHNDEMAVGVIKAARDLDLKVPGDVSVVGFDNIKFGEYCEPELTTVHQPREDIGRQAMKMMLDILASNDVPIRQTLRTQLIVRGSAGAKPQTH